MKQNGWIYRSLFKLLRKSLVYRVNHTVPTVRMGSDYGGWTIPKDLLHPNSVCYFAGAGEDISFDVDIAQKYKCEVNIFDPTPKATIHFDTLIEHARKNMKMPLYKDKGVYYTLNQEDIPLLKYHGFGLWSENKMVKFYTPQNPNHVSHSIVNLQKTNNYFEAEVKTVATVMQELGHHEVDILKLDIEGAEYEVLTKALEDQVKIKVFCIEFDEGHTPLSLRFHSRIRKMVKSILRSGYVIIDKDNQQNFTFIRKDLLNK